METFSFTHLVTASNGLHARPAGMLVNQARQYASSITITHPVSGKSADAKRLVSVMGLGVKQGDEITLSLIGAQARSEGESLRAYLQEHL